MECHTSHQYVKANNEYMENYNKDKESLYVMHWDADNLFRWTMSRKLTVGYFNWEKTHQHLLEVLK